MVLFKIPSAFTSFAGGPLGLIFSPIVLILITIGFFAIAVFIHMFFKMVSGKGRLGDTYGVFAYSSVSLLFGLIPIIGILVAIVYFIILVFTGLKVVHKLSAGRTIIGLFLPLIIVALLSALLWNSPLSDKHLSSGLEIPSVKFCIEISDDGKCNEITDDDLRAREQVFIYTEVRGLTAKQAGEVKKVWIIQHMKITDSKGNTVFDHEVTNGKLDERSFNMYWFNTPLNLGELAGGRYTLEVTFEDGYNPLKHGIYKKTFYVGE